MTLNQACAILARLSGYAVSEIDQRTRGLRKLGLIPEGGRGLNAAQLGADHLAAVVACMAARPAVGAWELVPKLLALRPVPRPGEEWPPGFAMTFGEVLTVALAEGSDRVSRAEMRCDGERAWAEFPGEAGAIRLAFARHVPSTQRALEVFWQRESAGEDECGHRFRIGPWAIDDLRIASRQQLAASSARVGSGDGEAA